MFTSRKRPSMLRLELLEARELPAVLIPGDPVQIGDPAADDGGNRLAPPAIWSRQRAIAPPPPPGPRCRCHEVNFCIQSITGVRVSVQVALQIVHPSPTRDR